MTVPLPEFDIEVANALWRLSSPGNPGIKLVHKAAATSLFITPVNTDASGTFPTGYTTFGGLGTGGLVAAVKTTAAVVADADFSGATPVVPAPPVGSLIYNNNTHKLFIRDAAASWLSSVAFT